MAGEQQAEQRDITAFFRPEPSKPGIPAQIITKVFSHSSPSQ